MSHDQEPNGTRRDFLYVATATTGAVTAGAAAWPLVNQMNPSADVQALASIEVDVSGIEPGTQITVKWRGKPVFIRRRTQDEIDAARDVALADLPDQEDRNDNKPGLDAADENRSIDPFTDADGNVAEGSIEGEWLVMMGVCTHLGCVPLGDAGDFNGWFCPCHGSHYDTSGRIRKGPAPTNLPVPTAAFINATTLKLG